MSELSKPLRAVFLKIGRTVEVFGVREDAIVRDYKFFKVPSKELAETLLKVVAEVSAYSFTVEEEGQKEEEAPRPTVLGRVTFHPHEVSSKWMVKITVGDEPLLDLSLPQGQRFGEELLAILQVAL